MDVYKLAGRHAQQPAESHAPLGNGPFKPVIWVTSAIDKLCGAVNAMDGVLLPWAHSHPDLEKVCHGIHGTVSTVQVEQL